MLTKILDLKDTLLYIFNEKKGFSPWKRNLMLFIVSFLYYILLNSLDGFSISMDFTHILSGGTELIEKRNPYSFEVFWKNRWLKYTNTPLISFIMITIALLPNPVLTYVTFLGIFISLGTIVVFEFFDDLSIKVLGVLLWLFLPFHIFQYQKGFLDPIMGVLTLASLLFYRRKDYDTSAFLLGLSVAIMYSSIFIVFPVLSTLQDRKTMVRYLIIAALPLFLVTLPFLLIDPIAALNPLLYQQAWNGRPPGWVWGMVARFLGLPTLTFYLKTFWVPIVAGIVLLFSYLDVDVRQKYVLPYLFALLFMKHAWGHYYTWITLLLIIELLSAKDWRFFYIQFVALFVLSDKKLGNLILDPVYNLVYRVYRLFFPRPKPSSFSFMLFELLKSNKDINTAVQAVIAMTIFGLLILVSSYIHRRKERISISLKDRKRGILLLLFSLYWIFYDLKLLLYISKLNNETSTSPHAVKPVDVWYSYTGSFPNYVNALFVLSLILLISIIALVFYLLIFEQHNKTILILRGKKFSILLIWFILNAAIMGGFLVLFNELETISPFLYGI